MPTKIIVGIDVGTHKICTVVAESDSGPNRLNVLGVGAVASEGVAKGMITDIVKASNAIGSSLDAAERQSGCRILSAYVSISGNHVSSTNSRGLVAVSHPERIIGQDDVARAVDAARAMAIPAGRDVLHVIPRTYTVDGQEGIRNPLGLSGFRLDVETHVVTGGSNVRENLIRCVQKADVEVDDLVLSPFASAEATLTEQEKNLGVALVDIGHGTTDISIYVEGSVWHSRIIPVGGWQLTNDLVLVFNIPFDAAEALKLQYGEAQTPSEMQAPKPQPAQVKAHTQSAGRRIESNGHAEGSTEIPHSALRTPHSEMLETQTFEGKPSRIPRDELNAVMAARLDQLFGLVGDEIRRSGYDGMLPAGVVLTGGVASMPNIASVASRKLRMPARVGRPRQIGGLTDAFDSPMYATSVGLILWGAKENAGSVASPGTGPQLRRSNVAEEREGLLAKWLRMFLPHG
ncbi:MAG TPA: cell division protein FtsA [Chloroflexia bacterium]|nr:cell division protein FtsA [Chloroflexia bacterium]